MFFSCQKRVRTKSVSWLHSQDILNILFWIYYLNHNIFKELFMALCYWFSLSVNAFVSEHIQSVSVNCLVSFLNEVDYK